jgi:hypothetical protein
MINLIDYTYFKGKLLVPNAAETGYVQNELNVIITEEQYNLLQMMLGPVLYEQFVLWYETLPQDTANPFNDLLNGKVFTNDNNFQVNWVGLVNSSKLSPIAGYVYCKWQQMNVTQSVSAGEVKTASQNAQAANGSDKFVTAWNSMVDMVDNYFQFMQKYFATNADWVAYRGHWLQWYNTQTFYSQPIIHKINSFDL